MSLVLTGCATKTISQKTEIEFWTLQLSAFDPYLNSVIAEYEKLHPDVIIKRVDIPFSEGEKRSLAAVMSKKTPDLINLNPDFSSILASKNALVDLNEYISPEQKKDYLPQALATNSNRDFLFGVPWYVTSAITIYNKEILSNSGIEKVPTNYDDMANIAPIIMQKTGKYAMLPNLSENGYMLKTFSKYDIPIIKDEKAVFSTDKSAQVMILWKNLYDKKYIPPESITETHRESLEKFQSEKTAFLIVGANFLKILAENSPQLFKKIDVAPQMSGTNGKVDFSIMNLVVPSKAQHKKEAVDFALFLTNSKNQLEFCKLAPILPSTKAALNSPYFKQTESDMFSKGRSISAQQLNNALDPLPYVKNKKSLFEITDNMTQSVMLGKISPKKGLNQAQDSFNSGY